MASLLGRGPQPWDPVLGTPQSLMEHSESWGEMGRSRGGPATGCLPLYLALAG